MKKIVVVTDSNSGITQEEAKEIGIRVLPMPFTIDDKEYLEDMTLTQEEFYEKLEADVEIFTSQPSVASVLELWDELLKEYDEIIHIAMSSALSSTCQTAIMLAADYDNRIHVVDNARISVTQKGSVLDAVEFIKQGKEASEVKSILEETKLESSIYIMVDTLKYLKKGGRVTPAAAAIGAVLNIKPVLQIQGGKLDAFAKVRGIKQGKRTMLDAIASDIEKRFSKDYEAKRIRFNVVHSNNEKAAVELAHEVKEIYKLEEVGIECMPLSVACHTGPGALAIAIDVVQS